jgi:hypothetical protein
MQTTITEVTAELNANNIPIFLSLAKSHSIIVDTNIDIIKKMEL